MSKVAKRMKAIYDDVDRDKFYPLDEAITLVKKGARAKFDESIDVAVNLGVNARQSEQNVRGATVMPRGTGKSVRVAVFADGPAADQAREAGAELVGMDDLAAQITGGEINFDVAIATPDAMPVVGKLGQILGPRGLMPNPKVGTVTPDVTKAVTDAKSGQIQFRIDRSGIIHCLIGKASFDDAAIKENLEALLAALQKAKPSAAKGQYIRRVTLSTTMGPGVRVDRGTLDI